MPRTLLATASALLALAPWAPAEAHPHVWIDAALRLDFAADGTVRSVGVTWTFDEMYSEVSVQGLDRDGDGAYAAAELAPMVEEAMGSLEEWLYFLDVRQEGRRLSTGRATDASAEFRDGRLTYRFTVPLNTAAAAPLEIKAYDPSFYIDVGLADAGAVTLRGAPAGCAVSVSDPPPMEEMMLMGEAALLNTEVEPGSEGLGGRFAQTMSVTCARR